MMKINIDDVHTALPSLVYFVRNPIVPFKTQMTSVMDIGTSIVVRGRVNANPYRFEINLTENNGNEKAIHINPRFDQRQCVFNSLYAGAWGPEERIVFHTLRENMDFNIRITCQHDGFRVDVNNNQESKFYRHRKQNYYGINGLEVSGDITLTGVQLTKG